MNSAKILLAAGLLAAGAVMVSPSAAGAMSHPAPPSAGPSVAPLATLHDPLPSEQDSFGQSVAVSGNTLIVGAINPDVDVNTNHGVVFVYTKGAGGWPATPTVTLADPAPGNLDFFGLVVAIAGGTIVVGAPDRAGGGPDPSAAYIYTEGAAGWPTSPTVKLRDPRPGPYDGFGGAVTVSGGITVLGAFNAAPRTGALSEGRAYVYGKTTAGWPTSPTVTLHRGAAAYFGYSVAAQGTTALISARDVVYVYRI